VTTVVSRLGTNPAVGTDAYTVIDGAGRQRYALQQVDANRWELSESIYDATVPGVT